MTAMENIFSHTIIGAAIEVHKILGPGLLESIYEHALCHELKLRGLNVDQQISVPVRYKSAEIRTPLCLDILIDNRVIIEVKSVEKMLPIYHAQLLSYLKLTGLKLGLLINFSEPTLKQGIHRIVNGL